VPIDRGRLAGIYRPIIAAMLRATAWLVQHLPRSLALHLGERCGALAARLLTVSSRRAQRNLRKALRKMGMRRKRFAYAYRLSRECFRCVGRSLVETLRLPAMAPEEILSLVRCDDLSPIERALARGKGVLILSAHMGTWEMLAAWLGVKFGRPFHAIGRRIYYNSYNELLVATRRRAGVETIYHDESPRRALGVLRENRAVGILADQDIEHLDSVFADYFGRPALTPTAPVAMARASGAALVPVFITWEGRRHRVHVLPEVELIRTKDRKADMRINTQQWTDALESVVRARLPQWAWFHSRWGTKPPKG
jgi:KDO2-lipid IV(A) lauroyltransferase